MFLRPIFISFNLSKICLFFIPLWFCLCCCPFCLITDWPLSTAGELLTTAGFTCQFPYNQVLIKQLQFVGQNALFLFFFITNKTFNNFVRKLKEPGLYFLLYNTTKKTEWNNKFSSDCLVFCCTLVKYLKRFIMSSTF